MTIVRLRRVPLDRSSRSMESFRYVYPFGMACHKTMMSVSENFGLGTFWMSATYGPEYWDPSDGPGYDFELLMIVRCTKYFGYYG